MKVLITGGAGFLGSHLGDAFLKRGDEVFALDTAKDFKISHNIGNPKFHYIRDSIFNDELLDTLALKCDLIYHMAAVVGVEHYVGDPYNVLNVNINGTQNVLKSAFKYNKKVVFTSTSEVYGRNPKIPFREDDDRVLGSTKIDRWCYSTSKAAGEHFCFAYHSMGLPVTVVRYFNAYGPRLDRVDVGRILTIFMGQILKGKDLTIIGDGKQTRCFTYIDDAIRATMAAGLMDETNGGIFNIGTDVETDILTLANLMIKIAGAKVGTKHVTKESIYGDSYEDIQRRVPDNTRMKTILKVTPEISLEEGLRRTIQWFMENEGRY
ncbi:MAG: NAD-dependent epimerase/dehydratase family protein [Candidatus Schekmanbacteria bacterium]|nr:NAD-dependent epimerase/dehydratase family protein [Candidatus Schekmanbacteria bacterium]